MSELRPCVQCQTPYPALNERQLKRIHRNEGPLTITCPQCGFGVHGPTGMHVASAWNTLATLREERDTLRTSIKRAIVRLEDRDDNRVVGTIDMLRKALGVSSEQA